MTVRQPPLFQVREVTKKYRMGEVEVIERVNRELGTTIAIITHNVGIAAMDDRVLTIR